MSDEEWPVDGGSDVDADSGGRLLLLLAAAVWLSLEFERRLEDDDEEFEAAEEAVRAARPVMEETITRYSESRSSESANAMVGTQITWLCSPAPLSRWSSVVYSPTSSCCCCCSSVG